MVNKVTLIGNLGTDPELKHLENGTAVARLSLATNERYQDKSGEWQTLTEWHNVILWRETAERAASRLKKGMLVYVEGKINYRKYTDKDGGEKQITDIVASTCRALEKTEGGSDWKMPAEEPSGKSQAADPQATAPVPDTKTEGGDDLPF